MVANKILLFLVFTVAITSVTAGWFDGVFKRDVRSVASKLTSAIKSKVSGIKAAAVGPTLKCTGATSESVIKCCGDPPDELFSTGILTTCSNQKVKGPLFKDVGIHSLNKYMDQKKLNAVVINNGTLRKIAEAACLLECVFTEYALGTATSIDYAAVTDFLKITATEEWKPILASAVDICKTAIEALEGKDIFTIKTLQKCSLMHYMFVQCMNRELVLTCPNQSTSQACTTKVNLVRNCDALSKVCLTGMCT